MAFNSDSERISLNNRHKGSLLLCLFPCLASSSNQGDFVVEYSQAHQLPTALTQSTRVRHGNPRQQIQQDNFFQEQSIPTSGNKHNSYVPTPVKHLSVASAQSQAQGQWMNIDINLNNVQTSNFQAASFDENSPADGVNKKGTFRGIMSVFGASRKQKHSSYLSGDALNDLDVDFEVYHPTDALRGRQPAGLKPSSFSSNKHASLHNSHVNDTRILQGFVNNNENVNTITSGEKELEFTLSTDVNKNRKDLEKREKERLKASEKNKMIQIKQQKLHQLEIEKRRKQQMKEQAIIKKQQSKSSSASAKSKPKPAATGSSKSTMKSSNGSSAPLKQQKSSNKIDVTSSAKQKNSNKIIVASSTKPSNNHINVKKQKDLRPMKAKPNPKSATKNPPPALQFSYKGNGNNKGKDKKVNKQSGKWFS